MPPTRIIAPSSALMVRVLCLICLSLQFSLMTAAATPIENDPKGFYNLTWGAPLADNPELTLVRSTPLIYDYVIRDYVLKNVAPTFAEASMENMIFSSIDGQFARVSMRYRGEKTHKQVMNFLEQRFGALDRIPGQMVRGMNQQYNWRGSDTEINLTYEAYNERGFVFFESRSLSPRFNEGLAETAE